MNIKTKELQDLQFVSVRKERTRIGVVKEPDEFQNGKNAPTPPVFS
jgi:hypothetical protein